MSGRRTNAWNDHQRLCAQLGMSREETRRSYHAQRAPVAAPTTPSSSSSAAARRAVRTTTSSPPAAATVLASGRAPNPWNEHQRSCAQLGMTREETRASYRSEPSRNTHVTPPVMSPSRSVAAAPPPARAATTHSRNSNPWNEHQRIAAQLGMSREEARASYHTKPSPRDVQASAVSKRAAMAEAAAARAAAQAQRVADARAASRTRDRFEPPMSPEPRSEWGDSAYHSEEEEEEEEEDKGWRDDHYQDSTPSIYDGQEVYSPKSSKTDAHSSYAAASSPRSVDELGGVRAGVAYEHRATRSDRVVSVLSSAMEAGTVEHVHPSGYGFLRSDRDSRSFPIDETKFVYFHVSVCSSQTPPPRVGERVEFVRDTTSVHPKVVQVVRAEGPSSRASTELDVLQGRAIGVEVTETPRGSHDYATMIALLNGHDGAYYIHEAAKMLAGSLDPDSLGNADAETQRLLLTIALNDEMDAATRRGLLSAASAPGAGIEDHARYF